MKYIKMFYITGLSLLWVAFSWADNQVEQIKKPIAHMQEQIYNFGKVLEGTKVVHDFIIQNNGDAILEIEKVNTTCGCTTTSYTKSIAPGEQGKITITLSTKNNGGRLLSKAVKVHTNDPEKRIIPLTINGSVNNFAGISTNYVSFRGDVNKQTEKTIRIKPLPEYPFTIKSIKVENEKELEVHLQEIRNNSDLQYELIVKNTQTKPGKISNQITINTDSDIKPQLTIRVGGYLSQPVNQMKKP